MAVAWLVLAVVLVAVELHHFAFYAMFGALGALAAAGVALVAPSAVALQVVVAIVVAAIGIRAVRPFVSRAVHRRHDGGHVARGVHGTLVGEVVVTLDVVRDPGRSGEAGHVRLAGERWLAISGNGAEIPSGTRVLVTGVRGTTLVVWPVGEIDPFFGDGATGAVAFDRPPEPGTKEQT
jgi:inner membrane protein